MSKSALVVIDIQNDITKHYRDIIDRPRHVSSRHPAMDREKRAAQFLSFAALTGYDDLIRETERLTDEALLLDEDRKAVLNARLEALLLAGAAESGRFTYFVPDSRKSGGAFATASGSIRKYDPIDQTILLDDGTLIPIENLTDVE
jgi:hypothetical protein